MYRYSFDARRGAWLVQINTFLIIWVSIRDAEGVKTFADHRSAEKYVTETGLEACYRNYAESYMGRISA
jgi:hypothetical protein